MPCKVREVSEQAVGCRRHLQGKLSWAPTACWALLSPSVPYPLPTCPCAYETLVERILCARLCTKKLPQRRRY